MYTSFTTHHPQTQTHTRNTAERTNGPDSHNIRIPNLNRNKRRHRIPIHFVCARVLCWAMCMFTGLLRLCWCGRSHAPAGKNAVVSESDVDTQKKLDKFNACDSRCCCRFSGALLLSLSLFLLIRGAMSPLVNSIHIDGSRVGQHMYYTYIHNVMYNLYISEHTRKFHVLPIWQESGVLSHRLWMWKGAAFGPGFADEMWLTRAEFAKRFSCVCICVFSSFKWKMHMQNLYFQSTVNTHERTDGRTMDYGPDAYRVVGHDAFGKAPFSVV